MESTTLIKTVDGDRTHTVTLDGLSDRELQNLVSLLGDNQLPSMSHIFFTLNSELSRLGLKRKKYLA